MKGNRIDATESGQVPILNEGDYGRAANGLWWVRPPGVRSAGPLSTPLYFELNPDVPKQGPDEAAEFHQVTEHEDGTISVKPSIQRVDEYHGYLQRGVWTENQ